MKERLPFIFIFIILSCAQTLAQSAKTRTLTGTLVTSQNEAVAGASIVTRSSASEQTTKSDSEGNFTLTVPREAVTLLITGKNIVTVEKTIKPDAPSGNLRIEVEYVIPKIHDSLIISASQLDPTIDRRNEAVYRDTLFSRDDQIFHTLDAGINAGQHEGGGKSLEIRRFGFNLDHGGVSGGLKVLVDNVQQNQGTQGHGQGYLGQLKSLTPELVQDVDILNGPFNAEYGDFSGLG